jgi:phosphohistidine swiveling domain-containing protein
VAAGERAYRGFRAVVRDRRQYFDHWHQRRAAMPKVLGTIPDVVEDPILVEIFGLNRNFLTTVRAGLTPGEVTTLTGIAAARGRASGVARVLSDADALHRVGPGEVLVCESTSPNWTPAFAKIAACVCDGGGMLSHAAIVGREYRVPTVTACGVATVVIRDGDLVEVDGDRGAVTVLRRAGGGG